MRYTMEELFAFMDSERIVRVTDDEGNTHVGQCWAYSAVQNLEEYGVEEPSLEIGPGELLFAGEIRKIEFHEGMMRRDGVDDAEGQSEISVKTQQ